MLASGVTNTNSMTGLGVLSRRGNIAINDDGTLSEIRALTMSYGHVSTFAGTPQTGTVYGINLQPIYAQGTITGNLYDIYITAPVTGGILTGSHYSIYQASTTAKNYFGGFVGIGKTIPATELNLSSATYPIGRLESSDTTLSGQQELGQIQFYGNDMSTNRTGIYAAITGKSSKSDPTNTGSIDGSGNEGGNLIFTLYRAPSGASQPFDPVEVMRLTQLGNVGISTNDPKANLEVEDGGTANAILVKITQDDSNVYGLIIGNDTYSTTDTLGLRFNLTDGGVGRISNSAASDLYIDALGTANISDIYLRSERYIYFQDYNAGTPATKMQFNAQTGYMDVFGIVETQGVKVDDTSHAEKFQIIYNATSNSLDFEYIG
jgi:hypothetical protein